MPRNHTAKSPGLRPEDAEDIYQFISEWSPPEWLPPAEAERRRSRRLELLDFYWHYHPRRRRLLGMPAPHRARLEDADFTFGGHIPPIYRKPWALVIIHDLWCSRRPSKDVKEWMMRELDLKPDAFRTMLYRARNRYFPGADLKERVRLCELDLETKSEPELWADMMTIFDRVEKSLASEKARRAWAHAKTNLIRLQQLDSAPSKKT